MPASLCPSSAVHHCRTPQPASDLVRRPEFAKWAPFRRRGTFFQSNVIRRAAAESLPDWTEWRVSNTWPDFFARRENWYSRRIDQRDLVSNPKTSSRCMRSNTSFPTGNTSSTHGEMTGKTLSTRPRTPRPSISPKPPRFVCTFFSQLPGLAPSRQMAAHDSFGVTGPWCRNTNSCITPAPRAGRFTRKRSPASWTGNSPIGN